MFAFDDRTSRKTRSCARSLLVCVLLLFPLMVRGETPSRGMERSHADPSTPTNPARDVYGISADDLISLSRKTITLTRGLDVILARLDHAVADAVRTLSNVEADSGSESRRPSPFLYGSRLEVCGENSPCARTAASADYVSMKSWAGLRLRAADRRPSRVPDVPWLGEGVEDFIGLNVEGQVFEDPEGGANLRVGDYRRREGRENPQRLAGNLRFRLVLLSDLKVSSELLAEYLKNQPGDSPDRWTYQGLLKANQGFRIYSVRGGLSTGLRVRRLDEALNRTMELNPWLGCDLLWGPVQIDSKVALKRSRLSNQRGDDTATVSVRLNYHLLPGKTLALTMESDHRPSSGFDTEDLSLGMSWNWVWDSPI